MRRLATGLLGAAVTAGATILARQQQPGGAARWERHNFRGRTVSLLGGVGAAAGALTGAAATGGRVGAAATLVAATGAGIGLADDLDPDAGASKGLKGHLRELSRGHVTTGALKLLGISAAAMVAAAIGTGLGARDHESAPTVLRRAGDVLASGALIAGTANLVNLFDLRPGRGLKATAIMAAPLAVAGPGAPLATTALGVVGAAWRDDLAEETMLGDVGANSLGALVGTALAVHPSARLRGAALAGVVGLTLLSEKVSFSKIIASTPGLRELDAWGRRG